MVNQNTKHQMATNEPTETNPKKGPNDFIRYSGMATKMAVVILLGVMGGQKLDEKVGTKSPWFTIAFSLISVAIAIYIVIKDTSPK